MMAGAVVCSLRLMVLKEAPSASIKMMLGTKDVAGWQGTRLSDAAKFRPLLAGEGHFPICRHTSLEA
jgi:hypothetical protein